MELEQALWRALRAASYLAFVLAWTAVALGAAIGAIPRRRASDPAAAWPGVRVVAGVLLQALGLAVVVGGARHPLAPPHAALAGNLILAPASASLFVWTQILSWRQRSSELITQGPFARLRHPVYASLLGMLVSTALLAWSPSHFAAGVALYVAGAELRIANEEQQLAAHFGEQFREWTRRVRWRYVPGIR